MEKIEKALKTRKRHYESVDSLLETELQLMIKQKVPISVSSLAKRAKVSRGTVYNHKTVFEKLSEKRGF